MLKKSCTLKTCILKVNKLVYFRSSRSQTKKCYSSSKTKNILAIHFSLNYRLAFSSRNKLKSTEMKANRCSLQEANQPQANQQGDCDHDWRKCTASKFLPDSPCLWGSHRGQAVIENCFSWQKGKTPPVLSKDGVDPSWIPKLPFAVAWIRSGKSDLFFFF